MAEAAKVVAVTGASGYIGTRLLQQLEGDPGVAQIVAFDVKPLAFPIHNIAVYRQDVREPIDEMLGRHRVDTLVHLAFVSRRGRSRREIESIRRNNWQSLDVALDSSVTAGVKHVIYISSNVIYGVHPNNPVAFSEEAALDNFPGFYYGRDIFLAERTLQSFTGQYPGIAVTVLRACPVMGSSDGNELVTRLFPRPLRGVGRNPPFQFLHEDDLARIMLDMIHQRTGGVFNLAGDGVVFLREMAEITHRKILNMPPALAYPLAWLSGSGAYNLDAMRYPVIMSTSKIKQTLDYRFRYSSIESLTAFANYTGL